MQKLSVNSNVKNYDVFIGKNLLNNFSSFYEENNLKLSEGRKAAIISDSKVNSLYGDTLLNNLTRAGYETEIIEFPKGEQSKSLDQLQKIYESLAKIGIKRSDLIVTLGGGVTGDLGGFAAATYLRGINYVNFPTSLLAQVDSSIGGKVAVDFKYGKNLIGSFYNPSCVFIDPSVLKTLPDKNFSEGLAEIVKCGAIYDKSFFNYLEDSSMDGLISSPEKMIERCLSIKKHFVEEDEKDLGVRMFLNFGHTLGHAIEKYFNYEFFSHGEAVSIGMCIITANSERLGITEEGTYKRLRDLLLKFNLPVKVDNLYAGDIVKYMQNDKKGKDKFINLILLKKVGEAFIKKVPYSELKNYFNFEGVL